MNPFSRRNKKGVLNKGNEKKGFWIGIVYGLIPHIGCIAFIVFSVLGVTAATTLFKPLLLNPYFFHILVAISIVFATASAVFYFKKQGFLSFQRKKGGLEISFLRGGVKRKRKYLLTLYGTTIGINLILFMVIFPIAANINAGMPLAAAILGFFGGGTELELNEAESLLTLEVSIPCPGHAPLIIGELKTIDGVGGVSFKFPNLFSVGYNPEITSKEQVLSLEVFSTYKARVVNEEAELNGGQLAENSALSESPDKNTLGTAGSCCGGGSGGGCGCGCSGL